MRLRTDSGSPYTITVPHDAVTDRRLSAADVGVYMRCRWLMDICFPYGDLAWLITELGMPDAETHDSVRRLVELGHLDLVGADDVEFHQARAVSQHVRDAIDATLDDLTPAERVAVARLADLVDLRLDRAVAAQRSKHLPDE
ncbi:hypothetical protein [Streptomyces sp. DH7]|uniref:hypothetical protein n=1 Tax=Streptomyces sp. DH7 TaxID=2857006 RepID=UPI001E616579|nr:hypothetical protein [Streptomyces sp. DH7]